MMIRVTQYLLFLSVFITSTTGLTLTFEATPTPVLLNLTAAAEMRCDVTDSADGDNLKHVTSISVTDQDGADVAMVTAFDAPAALADPNNLQAKGSVSATSGEGSLQMTWAHPSLMTFGLYMCTVHAIDAEGHHVMLTKEVNVTAAAPSVMDWINDLRNQVQSQHLTIGQQQQEINQLSDKLQMCSTTVVFMAATSSSRFSSGRLTLPAGQHVIYDDVLLNIGGDYDEQTGIFKCSVPGVYYFQAHALNADQNDIALGVQVNSVTMASLYGGAGSHWVSDSMAATLHLKARDEVKIQVIRTSTFHYTADLHNTNVFSGNLLKADACYLGMTQQQIGRR